MMHTEQKVYKANRAFQSISKNPGCSNWKSPFSKNCELNLVENPENFCYHIRLCKVIVLENNYFKVPGDFKDLKQQTKVQNCNGININSLKRSNHFTKFDKTKAVKRKVITSSSGDSKRAKKMNKEATSNNSGDSKDTSKNRKEKCVWMLDEAWKPEENLPVKISKVVIQAMQAMDGREYHSLRNIKKYLEENSNVNVQEMDSAIKSFIKWAVESKVILKNDRKYKIPNAKEKKQIARELKKKKASLNVSSNKQ